MRFLIDRCAGRRIADRLKALGHDVVEARERGPDPGDKTLLQWADAEQRILVTMDKDFGALIFLENAAHAGVIRLPHVPSEQRIALLVQLLTDHAAEEIEGAIVTVRGTRVRIARPRERP